MAALFKSLFKSKKSKKESKDDSNNEDDYSVFESCQKKKPTARFADDCLLPATAAYHTKSAPRLPKGPQSCPGGNRDDTLYSRRIHGKNQKIDIDSGHNSRHPSRSSSMKHAKSQYSMYRSERSSQSEDEENDEDDRENYSDRVEMFERKSHYYMAKFEESERQRREDRRKQEALEKERNSIQSAMSNMAYCMASAQQMEQLKKERDQYRKEATRYKTKCEKLENKFETMSPSFAAGFQSFHNAMQQSPFHTPQYPPAPLSFNYPKPTMQPMTAPLSSLHRSMDFMNKLPGGGGGAAAMPPPHNNFGLLLSSSSASSNHGGSMSFAMSNTPTTIGSDGGGAGESLANPSEISFLRGGKAPPNFYNHDDDDECDEIKNYRYDDAFLAPSPLSDITQSTATTSNNF